MASDLHEESCPGNYIGLGATAPLKMIVCVLFLFLLVGCEPKINYAEPEHDQVVTLRIKRAPAFWGMFAWYDVIANGQRIGALQAGDQLDVRLETGKHSIRLEFLGRQMSNRFEFSAAPGEVVELHCGNTNSSGFCTLEERWDNRILVILENLIYIPASIEEVSVPVGAMITVSRSRTVEYELSAEWSLISETKAGLDVRSVLTAEITNGMQRAGEKSYEESETISHQVILSGIDSEKFVLTWVDVWRQGRVVIQERNSSTEIPFRVRVGTKLNVEPS